MPYICLDENEVIQKEDVIVFNSDKELKVSIIQHLGKCTPKILPGWQDRICAVLHWEDPKTRCLSEDEALQRGDAIIYQDQYNPVVVQNGLQGVVLENLMGWESGIVAAVLREEQ
jgi:hypothetical protein